MVVAGHSTSKSADHFDLLRVRDAGTQAFEGNDVVMEWPSHAASRIFNRLAPVRDHGRQGCSVPLLRQVHAQRETPVR